MSPVPDHGHEGRQAWTLTLTRRGLPLVAPQSVFLTHCCGLLTGFQLKALVTFIHHFTIQRELISRKGPISWGLWDSTGHSWRERDQHRVILYGYEIFCFSCQLHQLHIETIKIFIFLMCGIRIHIFKVLRIFRVNGEMTEPWLE